MESKSKESATFADFINNSSEKEKGDVYKVVLAKVSALQDSMVMQYYKPREVVTEDREDEL